MSGSQAFPPPCNRWAALCVLALTAALASAFHALASAQEQTYRLQGLFCNTEAQIDEALGYVSRNVAPRLAVELANDDEIVCTYIDLLHYVVAQPVIIGESYGRVPLVKYEAKLVGVV